MDTNECGIAINELADTASIKEKTEMLKTFLADETFKNVVIYAMEPLTNFGILETSIKVEYNQDALAPFSDRTWHMLNRLRDRKLTGNAARQEIEAEIRQLHYLSANILIDILNKDLHCGIGVKLVNKAYGSALLSEHPYMRCSLPKDAKLDTWDWKSGVLSQVKLDGMYATITSSDGIMKVHTRNGNEFNTLSEDWDKLREDCLNAFPPDIQLNGELLIANKATGGLLDRKTGNGLLNSMLKKNTKLDEKYSLCYIAWDMLTLREVKEKLSTRMYESRLADIMLVVNQFGNGGVKCIDTRVVNSLNEAYEHFNEERKEGNEGTVIKKHDGIWKSGTSKSQVKLKEEAEADLRVITMLEGTGKNQTLFGSLLCETEDKKLRVAISGFTDQQRLDIFNYWKEDKWEGAVIAVKYNEVIKQKGSDRHSLFLPRFVERRFDKEFADNLGDLQ